MTSLEKLKLNVYSLQIILEVFNEIFAVEGCIALQVSLDKIEGWCLKNNLKMNASKRVYYFLFI